MTGSLAGVNGSWIGVEQGLLTIHSTFTFRLQSRAGRQASFALHPADVMNSILRKYSDSLVPVAIYVALACFAILCYLELL